MRDLQPDAPVGHSSPPWLITFADLMVLLMCFFVLMLSFSEMDPEKFKLMSGSLHEAFGVQTDVTASDVPKGTSLEAQEFSPAVSEPAETNEVRQHTVDSDLNTLDLGLVDQGSPLVTLRGNGSLFGNPSFEQDVDAEERELAAELEDLDLVPYLTLGFVFRF